MGTTVDSLDIQIAAQAKSANSSFDAMIRKLDRINASLSRTSGSGMAVMANGVTRLASAMQQMNGVKTADFTRLTTNLTKLGSIDVAKIRSSSVAIAGLTKSLSNLSTTNGSGAASQIGDLAKGIAQLGYKSSTQAIENIPKLAVAMKDLMKTLSGAPKVSKNLIDMTNSLANLARTGASSGRAANSLATSLNTYSSSTKRAKTHTFSLASAIGKLYASYWLLFRGIGKIMDSINLASDLQEVNNVVLQTFGNYSGILEKMTETSIQDFGISELTAKQIASRFQAMGTSMGFTQGKMAEMSVSLTELSADMSSFYNVDASEIAKSLQAVFTGETEPLRKYGLDLSQATLQQWALKNGIDATVASMSYQEKTLLRYQYVMANTAAAQGDFARTSDSWANTIRRLSESFKALGTIVGTTLISAFKPLLNYLATVVQKVISFVQTIANALGSIFGWTLEINPSGSVDDATSGLEDISSAADDAGGSLGGAADKAKELMDILSFDEINKLSDISDSSGGSGSGGGGGAGNAATGGGATAEFVRTESLFEKYTSEIKSLEQLGKYIGDALTKSMSNINWQKVYKTAEKFGTGLADFLNGLISPELFGALGKTIANSINTAINAVFSFGVTFNWKNLGKSISEGINQLVFNFDANKAASAFNVWAHGLLDTGIEAVSGINWKELGQKIGQFLEKIDWWGILKKVAKIIWDVFSGAISSYGSSFTAAPIETIIITAIGLLKFKGLSKSIGSKIFDVINTALTGSAAASEITAITNSFGVILGGALLVAIGQVAVNEITGGPEALAEAVRNKIDEALNKQEWKFGIPSLVNISEWFQGLFPFITQNSNDTTPEIEVSIEADTETFKEEIQEAANYQNKTLPSETVVDVDADTKPAEKTYSKLQKEYGRGKNPLLTYLNVLPTGVAEQIKEIGGETELSVPAKISTKPYQLTNKLQTSMNAFQLALSAKIGTSASKIQKDASEKVKGYQLPLETTVTTTKEAMQKSLNGTLAGLDLSLGVKANVDDVNYRLTNDQKTIDTRANFTSRTNSLSDKEKQFSAVANFVSRIIGLSDKEKQFSTKAVFESSVDKLKNKTFTGFTSVFSSLSDSVPAWKKIIYGVTGNVNKLEKASGLSLGLSAVVSSVGNLFKAVFKADGGVYSGGSWKPITAFAGGGVPTDGQYFIAREAGPELVGTIGGHTAVMNNDQIVSSVSDGVARAVASVMSSYMSNGQVTEVNVNLEGDAKGIFRVVKQENDRIVRSTGRSALLV